MAQRECVFCGEETAPEWIACAQCAQLAAQRVYEEMPSGDIKVELRQRRRQAPTAAVAAGHPWATNWGLKGTHSEGS